MFPSHVLGLQNLYSSVQFRPAPPTPLTENTANSTSFSARSGVVPNTLTTAENGEWAAKPGAPSGSRPSSTDFRPSYGAGWPIPLTRGQIAIVDPEDRHTAAALRWHISSRNGKSYAVAHEPGSGDCNRRIRMHRLLSGAPTGLPCDHIDGDGLNNRRYNLRICTHSQNGKNQKPHARKGVGRFKGVYFETGAGSWRAHITSDGKKRNLGNYNTEDEAARAYDAAALKLHGEFARLNFPEARGEEPTA